MLRDLDKAGLSYTSYNLKDLNNMSLKAMEDLKFPSTIAATGLPISFQSTFSDQLSMIPLCREIYPNT